MGMGLRLLILVLVGVVTVLGAETPRAHAQSFRSLDLVQQRDLKTLFKKLYILGDQNRQAHATGLEAYQIEQLQQASRLFAVDEPPYDNTRSKTEALFDYQSLKNMLDYSFELQLRDNQISLPQLYEQLRQKAESDDFETAYRLGLTELDLRTKRWACPVFSESLPLPELSFHSLQILWPELERHTYQEIFSPEAMPFDEFQNTLHQLKRSEISDDEIRLSYWRYLSLGLARLLEIDSEESFRRHLSWAQSQMKALPQAANDPTDYGQFLEFAPFYFLLLEACLENPSIEWSLGFHGEANDHSELHALQFLESRYANEWLNLLDFGSSAEQIQALESGESLSILHPLLHEVDMMIRESSWFEEEEIETFEIALEQLRSGLHFKIDFENLAYFQLRPELQQLLVVRLFPQFSMKVGAALIEFRFHELSLGERALVTNHAYRTTDSLKDFLERFHQLDITRSDQVQRLHEDLANHLLQENETELNELEDLYKRLTTIELLDGGRIQSASTARAEMRALLEDLKGREDSPSALVSWMMVNLFPYPGFLRDEAIRFENEWERMTRQRSLTEDYNEAIENEDYHLIPELEQEIADILFTEERLPKTDLGSVAVYMARFSKGALDEPLQTTAYVGVGVLFTIVMKTVGGKIIMSYIMADSGVSLVRSLYRPDGLDEWQEVGLENGITPLGRIFNEGLLSMADQLTIVGFSQDSAKKLQATSALGQMTSDVLAFGVGARIAAAALPWYRVTRWRGIERTESKIHQTELKIARIDQDIARLREQINRLEAELPRYEPHQAQYKSTRNQIFQTKHRLAVLETGLSQHYNGRILNFANRSLRAAVSFGRDLFLFPVQKSRVKFGSRVKTQISRWRERYQMSRPQYEARLDSLLSKLDKQRAKLFKDSTRPSWLQPMNRLRVEWDEIRFARRMKSSSQQLVKIEEAAVKFSDELTGLSESHQADRATKALARTVEEIRLFSQKWTEDLQRIGELESTLAPRQSIVDWAAALKRPLHPQKAVHDLRAFQAYSQWAYLSQQKMFLLRQSQSVQAVIREVFRQSQHSQFLLNPEVIASLKTLAQWQRSIQSQKANLTANLGVYTQVRSRLARAGRTTPVVGRHLLEMTDVLRMLESGVPLPRRTSLNPQGWKRFVESREMSMLGKSELEGVSVRLVGNGPWPSFQEGAYRFVVLGDSQILAILESRAGPRLLARLFVASP